MRKTAVFLSAAALVLGASQLTAQAPSFAGAWTMVVDPAAAPPAGGRGGRGGLGQAATIVQDAKTLTVTRTTQNGEMKSVYNLDGTDSKNTMNFGGNPVEQTSKAKWDGGKLVITTSSSFNGSAFETTMALSLEGGNLIVESRLPSRDGGAPTTAKTTYKKS